MEIWAGTITTDDPSTSIRDIQLWSTNPHARNLLSHNAKLHYLSLVHVPSIPLYLAAGPCLEVSAENEITIRWISEALLSQGDINSRGTGILGPWWCHEGAQSEYGILLCVSHGETGQHSRGDVTELMLYAAAKNKLAELPTPPVSSSPVSLEDPSQESLNGRDTKVYALPLCSRIFHHIQKAAGLVTTAQDCLPAPGQAIFLPQNPDLSEDRLGAHQKRQSLSSLFEDATQKRRKLKSRGGESISKAMADINRLSSQTGLPLSLEREEAEASILPHKSHAGRRSLSRSSSMISLSKPECARPASRSGPLAAGKRSSLHRVQSAISPRDSPMLADVDGGYAQQNKAALTKVVMAGMRLHGLQQRKRQGKVSGTEDRPKTAASIGDGVLSEADDEYKLVYHQTFKAAMFAFRRHFSAHVISQDAMRDIVDRFLNLFCSDPWAESGINEGGLSAFGMSSQKSANAFDEPSAGISSIPDSLWSPPIVKNG